MNLSLLHKTALISGSTQGIGLAASTELAALGASCVLFARNESALQNVITQLDTSKGQQHQYLVADFTNPEQVKIAIENFIAQHTIHIVVNNTGGPMAGPVNTATPDAFLAAFNQHLICNQIIVQAVLPGMKAAGYGRIINVISTSVKIPLHNLGVSNTIRGAVASWAKTLSNELGQFNITVNNVLPGATNTGRLKAIISSNATKQQLDEAAVATAMQSEIPMKRFGEPEEIAALIAFLASPAAGYINGTSIPVDGGRTGSI
ncbi:MAG: SDR family oxidoreductase [Ferruginibacter sp.]